MRRGGDDEPRDVSQEMIDSINEGITALKPGFVQIRVEDVVWEECRMLQMLLFRKSANHSVWLKPFSLELFVFVDTGSGVWFVVFCWCRDPGDCLSPVPVWSLPLFLSKDFWPGMGSDGF